MSDRKGYVANQNAKAIHMAEFMHEMEIDPKSAWEADATTKKLVSGAAAERMDLKTGRPEVDAGKLNLRKVRFPSEETWAKACTHLQHMYDQDAIPDRDLFAAVYAVEPR